MTEFETLGAVQEGHSYYTVIIEMQEGAAYEKWRGGGKCLAVVRLVSWQVCVHPKTLLLTELDRWPGWGRRKSFENWILRSARDIDGWEITNFAANSPCLHSYPIGSCLTRTVPWCKLGSKVSICMHAGIASFLHRLLTYTLNQLVWFWHSYAMIKKHKRRAIPTPRWEWQRDS